MRQTDRQTDARQIELSQYINGRLHTMRRAVKPDYCTCMHRNIFLGTDFGALSVGYAGEQFLTALVIRSLTDTICYTQSLHTVILTALHVVLKPTAGSSRRTRIRGQRYIAQYMLIPELFVPGHSRSSISIPIDSSSHPLLHGSVSQKHRLKGRKSLICLIHSHLMYCLDLSCLSTFLMLLFLIHIKSVAAVNAIRSNLNKL